MSVEDLSLEIPLFLVIDESQCCVLGSTPRGRQKQREGFLSDKLAIGCIVRNMRLRVTSEQDINLLSGSAMVSVVCKKIHNFVPWLRV